MTRETELTIVSQDPIGFVMKLTGESIAVSPSGTVRPLHVGEPVYPSEKVVSKTGGILVEFMDGSSLNLGPNDQTVLVSEIVSSHRDNADVASESVTDVATIHGALQAGADPTHVSESPAAGQQASLSPDSEGTVGMMEMVREGHETISDAGFGTDSNSISSSNLNNITEQLNNDSEIGDDSELADVASEIMTSDEADNFIQNPVSESGSNPIPPLPERPSITGNQGPATATYQFTIEENSQEGAALGGVGPNSNTTYSFSNNSQTSPDGLFEIDKITGEITLTDAGEKSQALDYEANLPIDDLEVIATDNAGNSTPLKVEAKVTDVDEPLTVKDIDLGQMNEDGSIIIDASQLLANANDPEGKPLSVTSLTLKNTATNQLQQVSPTEWKFTPEKNFSANDVEFEFTVSDGISSETASAVVDVIPVADAPTLTANVSSTDFNLIGDSKLDSDGAIILTENSQNQHGTAWSENTIDLTRDFKLNFDLYFGDKNGADGIVFVLQKEGTNAKGDTGEGLGYGGLTESFGIEFDTYQNGNRQDITNDHAAFVSNGTVSHNQNTNNGLGSAKDLGDIEDDQWHNVQITWDASTKTITYEFYKQDGSLVASDSLVNRDIVNSDLGGVSDVWFGFTASTGGETNTQKVRNVELSDNTIKLDIEAELTDNDEKLSDIVIEQVPNDVVLLAGTKNPDGSWTLSQSQLKDLSLDTQNYTGDQDFTLVVKASSSEANGSTATTYKPITIEINGVDTTAPGVVISAGQGNDSILSSAGDDIFTGNGGADEFVWQNGATGVDHITDFSKGQDVVNLSDLLIGESKNTIDNYLQIKTGNNYTTLEVSSAGNNQVTQKIVLDNVDLFTEYGVAVTDSHSLVQNMIQEGTLITD